MQLSALDSDILSSQLKDGRSPDGVDIEGLQDASISSDT
jgi:hypothetical protein